MTPFEIADALRACLESAYSEDPDAPAEICHRPGGEVPFNAGLSQDECCSGLAWVRVSSVDPVVDPAASENPDFNPCASGDFRVVLELGAVRCNPSGTPERGPRCDEWTALALRMDQDRAAMRSAVCCFRDSDDVGDYLPVYRVRAGSWSPIDSSGGCAGGTMQVTAWTQCREC
jgi:hypothetical protein